ncbi:MAG: 2-C-methyl-D-erythritol 2,4-cyclodiphosphate synthase [Eubacterium sp.]|nr:2-C-methyl-D-erythritol 2,4-cyclodiphosphate synthase [Eubacterium sp.]
MEFRIGHGFDVHRLVPDRKLILGGIHIPYELGLLGHSDADVLAHALMDAMLGACAIGDIGHLFPDNDDRFLGADSMKLLDEVVRLTADKGWLLSNCDITVICQKPKLAGYINDIRVNLAEVIGVEPDQISVKATTTEKLGFTGRGEGIAAEAVCLMRRI